MAVDSKKITEYFPSSPKLDEGASDDKKGQKTPPPVKKSLESLGTPFLTPDNTPTKPLKNNDSKRDDIPKLDLDETDGKEKHKSEEKKDEAKVEKSKSRNRRRGRRKKKGKAIEEPKTTAVDSKAEEVVTSKPKKDIKGKKDPTKTNHLLTDYFPVRRSDRRPKSEIEKEKQEDLQKKILSGCRDGLKIVEFEGKGRGIVSTKTFKRGDFIVEYAGDLIAPEDARKREEKYKKDSNFGCYMYYFKYNNKSYCVDATAESGKYGRLLNHSKLNYNCQTRTVGIGDTPYLIIVAARDIKEGEELLYDYGDRDKETLLANPWLAT